MAESYAKLMGADVEVPQIKLRPLKSLVAYAQNSRTHSAGQIDELQGLLREYGWTNAVLMDNMGIVAGHGRCMAADAMYARGEQIKFPNGTPIPIGLVPTLDCTGWSDAQRKAYIIADNRSALSAGWDEEVLRTELLALKEVDFDLALTAFSYEELDKLLADVPPLDQLPVLPTGDKDPFEQMTFTLSNEQAAEVQSALALAASLGPYDSENKNSNGNALARICETFLSQNGGSTDGDVF